MIKPMLAVPVIPSSASKILLPVGLDNTKHPRGLLQLLALVRELSCESCIIKKEPCCRQGEGRTWKCGACEAEDLDCTWEYGAPLHPMQL